MDFQKIERLSDENIEDLYSDIVLNESDEIAAVYTYSYYTVYCRTGENAGRTGTGWGVSYTETATCTSVDQLWPGYCNTKKAYKGSGGWHHVYNLGVYDACGPDETGYACITNCNYTPRTDS